MTTHGIPLRMIVFKSTDHWTMICLETYIAVQAEGWEELEAKMRDASSLYFQSFSSQEIERRAYIRLAPYRYRLQWTLRSAFLNATRLFSGPLRAIYDPLNARLQFA